MEIDVRTQDQVKIVKLRGKLNLGAALDRANVRGIEDLPALSPSLNSMAMPPLSP